MIPRTHMLTNTGTRLYQHDEVKHAKPRRNTKCEMKKKLTSSSVLLAAAVEGDTLIPSETAMAAPKTLTRRALVMSSPRRTAATAAAVAVVGLCQTPASET